MSQESIDALALKHKQREQTHELRAMLDKRIPALIEVLPQGMKESMAQRMIGVAWKTISTSSTLMQCSPRSIVSSVFEAAQLGLAIDGVLGHAYLVPFKIKGRYQSQLQIGYRGLIELAYRSGKISRVAAAVIRQNDKFAYEEGTRAHLNHQKPLTGDRGDVIGAFAVAHPVTASGTPTFRVLRLDEVHAHREHSNAWKYAEKGKKDSVWHVHPDPMARKTAIRDLAKWLPQCPDLERAAIADEHRDHGIGTPSFTGTVIDVGDDDWDPETGEISPEEEARMKKEMETNANNS